MPINFFKSILLTSLASLPVAAMPQVVEISISQETQFGQSVFVSADHPAFGDGDVTKAVKLSPHNYPVWSIATELPPNLNLEFEYYIRSDAADSLPDGNNGNLVSSESISSESETQSPQKIRVLSESTATAGEVRITSNGTQITTITMEKEVINSETFFKAEIPATHRNEGHFFEVFIDGAAVLENTSPIPAHATSTTIQNGQAFLYTPPTTDFDPSEPRRETFQFELTGFPSRQIKVLLPRGYDQNIDKRYPVIYMQDGQNVFSPGGTFGSWDADITINNMIAHGELPEVITVAIDNTNERFAEYTPEYGAIGPTQGRGGEFLGTIINELVPKINNDYRTLTGPENTIHVGSSLGGLLGFFAAVNRDEAFGTVIAMSPSFQIGTDDNLSLTEEPVDSWARIYLDSGTGGASNDGYVNTITVRDSMIENGHVFGIDFIHQVGLTQQHNEAAWRSRLPNALRWWAAPLLNSSVPINNTSWIIE